jgi:hypothetical protein
MQLLYKARGNIPRCWWILRIAPALLYHSADADAGATTAGRAFSYISLRAELGRLGADLKTLPSTVNKQRGPMQIFVKTLTGRTIALNVDAASDTKSDAWQLENHPLFDYLIHNHIDGSAELMHYILQCLYQHEPIYFGDTEQTLPPFDIDNVREILDIIAARVGYVPGEKNKS